MATLATNLRFSSIAVKAGLPQQPLKDIPQHLRRYEIHDYDLCIDEERILGRGGASIVKLGILRPKSCGVKVAVKVLTAKGDAMMPSRLFREVTPWVLIDSHPNILKFLGFSLSPDGAEARLVSPYMKNGNVVEYIKRNRLNMEERLRLVLQVLNGLVHMHSQNPPVHHGDLKGANILVTDDGNAVLNDLGLARQEIDHTGYTTTSPFQCTPSWASPECLERSRRTTMSDMWSWACCVLEIVKDARPYAHLNKPFGAIFRGELPADTNIFNDLPVLKDIVESCWRREPEHRPTAAECYRKLSSSAIFRATNLPSDNLKNGQTYAPVAEISLWEDTTGTVSLGRDRRDRAKPSPDIRSLWILGLLAVITAIIMICGSRSCF